MESMFGKSAEKKVEYLELIYDLIFVYLIGRNNSLIHTVAGGFVPAETFCTYILCTLIVLQIWMFSTMFINRYGVNGIQEHLMIFANMYLLYFMADGTRISWQNYYLRYNLSWGLIILNLLLQYYLKYRKAGKAMPWVTEQIKSSMRMLMIMAGIILLSLPVYFLTGIPLSPLAMVFGIVSSLMSGDVNRLVRVDFGHLTERVMLYVVFTFGEMIIGISGYFGGNERISMATIYFSLMAFLVVAGLFFIYGFVYDHVVDREMETDGTSYMLLHVFLIMALNFITSGMEFMPEESVAALPKNIFLTLSILMYFAFLSQTARFALHKPGEDQHIYRDLGIAGAVFAVLIALTYRNGFISIAISVIFVYLVFAHMYFSWKKQSKEAES